MPLKPSKFKLDEEVVLSGKPMRVAGLVQYEAGNDQLVTRYLLAEPTGAPVILQEDSGGLSMLRPFPPAAQPVAAGSTVTVMGEKYALAGVRKLKVLGAAGQPPGGTPRAPLLLSGLFGGPMGSLVREMAPGAAAQAFFSLKPVPAEDVLSGEQVAKKQEAERMAADLKAQAADEEDTAAAGNPLTKAAVWIVMILVVVGLGFACSGSEDEGSSSSGSARSSVHVGGGHGGK